MAVKRGVWIVIVLLVVAICISGLGVLMLVGLAGRAPEIASNSTLVLRVSGDIPERDPGGVFGPFLEGAPTVRSFVEMLRRAKTDKRVTSVILKPTGAGALWGKVQEVRDAVTDFRRSGKPIVAYLEYGGEQEFYLATACDKVFLMPSSTLELTGMASYELFLRGTLDKIGAYPDAMHIGEYKTYSNTFTQKTYTAAHREMAESLNTDLYDQLVRGIADGRHKSEADVKALIDHGPYLPEDALRAGLIDDLAYDDEVEGKMKLAAGKSRMLDMNDYRQAAGDASGHGQRIAIIYASGIIASGKSTYDTTGGEVVGADTINEYLRKARADSTIKAIVLRVDSPGGSALASDVIWREVFLTKKQKPVIASMSDVAASGGYYIAMPSDAIVAEPSTLTGSIGVVLTKFVIDGTLKKLGMNMEGVSRGKFADLYSPVRPFSPDERARMESYMQATYDTFVEKAAQGRNTTPEKIDLVGQGRVWTGRQAKEIGLVDDLGGLDRAIALAKQRAKIAQDADVELVVYPPKKSFYDVLTNPLGASDRAGTLASLLGFGSPRVLQALAAPLQVFRRGEPLAIMPNVFAR
jgi:protease IV